MIRRHVCIHGHFYQPARENPWTGQIDRQESAAPDHDWNERVAAECYTPNTGARLLAPDGTVDRTTNNYRRISFNFGPTLLAWLESRLPDTYRAIIEADCDGADRTGGHGPALAQPYGHSILPLDSARDRRTQLIWGMRDFEHRFGRRPEGIWLPETAVDTPTLEAVAALGFRFTILAPGQAAAVRRIGTRRWHDLAGTGINPRLPYRCALPSGRSISLFFYDGPVSHDIAFGGLLEDGDRLAKRLLGAFGPEHESAAGELVSVATDGETYGHHHRFGEMALARCIDRLDANPDVRLTVFGEFLERHPPASEVRIRERTAWSCAHGLGRWQADCGCSTGAHPDWNQTWRGPLRAALNWLREALAPVFERQLIRFVADPWTARDEYVDVILNRISGTDLLARLTRSAPGSSPRTEPTGPTAAADRERILGLLEMQRYCLLMFSSCGWFFDDISELTSVQVLRYAARAIELCRSHAASDLEPGFLDILGRANSNLPGTGADVYRRLALAARPTQDG